MDADGPQRIQRLRTKGWRMPAGAVYVGRPTKWGNPWRVEVVNGVGWCCTDTNTGFSVPYEGPLHAHQGAVRIYRAWLHEQPALLDAVRAALRGKPLCCYCPTHLPCHADVLLELANG